MKKLTNNHGKFFSKVDRVYCKSSEATYNFAGFAVIVTRPQSLGPGFLRRETCRTWESAVQREDRSHQMSLEEKKDTVSRRVSLAEINHDFDVR